MVFENLNGYLDAVESLMRDSVAVFEESLASYYGMISYHLGWVSQDFSPSVQDAGKRLRPLLCLLSCEACGGDWRQAVPAAAAIELIHNFSLIHDDIEDNSPMRRHRPTVWSLWGLAQGINVGDGLFAISRLALQRLTQEGISPAKTLRAFRIVDQTCLLLTEGQYLDLAFEEQLSVEIELYMEMIGRKTAALMSCATELGALLGSENDGLVERYKAFGYQLGLLFQIVDDILGIWGAGGATGKGVGEDIVNKKKSLPVVYGLERSEPLRQLYRSDVLDQTQQQAAMELLDALSARDYCQRMANEKFELAVEILDGASIRNEAQNRLRTIAQFLLERQR